jgi:hypothetical protein
MVSGSFGKKLIDWKVLGGFQQTRELPVVSFPKRVTVVVFSTYKIQ